MTARTPRLVTFVLQSESRGRSTALVYTSRWDDVTRVTDPLGHTWTYSSDKLGRITQVRSPLGHRHAYVYDNNGRLVSGANHLSQSIAYAYDSRRVLDSITLPEGISASYARNDLGRITRIMVPRQGVQRDGVPLPTR